MRISKSKFVAGVQCLKRLYFQVHEPELATGSGEATQAIMNQGRQVGLIAQKAFPGGVTVTVDHGRLDDAVRVTKELVGNEEVPAIFEATFEYGGVLVRTDVLERQSSTEHRLIEVKSATSPKPYYSYDLGIQKHVLEGAGISLEGSCLMYLNSDYVFDGQKYDVARLFVVTGLTQQQAISDAEISSRVNDQLRILGQPVPPEVDPGRQCTEPVLCEFYDHCNPDLPHDDVRLLPRISKTKMDDLQALGITSIPHIPNDFPLTEKQRRVLDTAKTGKMWISPELAGQLSELRYPICYMDFETIFPALPRFAGMRPYDHVPFQWSVHRQEQTGEPIRRYDFLAESTADPRVPFLESLCQAVKVAGNIVVYNQGFEDSRLDDLARWLPEHRSEIDGIKAKLWDLLAVMRKNVYHPAFVGSFSLKSVLPALVPEMSYDGLGVSEGIQAGIVWGRFVDPATRAEEKAQLKQGLLQYCGQDTLALARIVEALMKVTGINAS